jgi:hypothetical protein
MIRINYRYQIWQFIILVILQIPLLYKFILFDKAFGFFYIGFLLLLPYRISPFLKLSIGFFIGLLIDIFSNTPGMHASASVLVIFIKDYWLLAVSEEPEEDINISVNILGRLTASIYLLPLIFVHHLIIFSLEYGRLEGYGSVLIKIFWSSLLTFVTVYVFNLMIAPKRRRA